MEKLNVSQLVIKAIFILTTIASGWLIIPNLIQWLVSKELVISPEANPELFQAWQQPPVPVFLKVYLFNVSNPNEVIVGAKPMLKEMGPYVFQEFRTKVNVSLDDTLDTVTYMEKIRYQFRQDLSGQFSLRDKVTLINVPFAAAAIKIQNQLPWILRHVAHMILLNYKEPLFITKTVQKALFEGWKVPFLGKIEEEMGISVLENSTFGFFVGMNNSAQGPYTIKRGLYGDKGAFGKVVSFKNKTTLDFWGDSTTNCNQINGTDGTIFSPNLNRDYVLKIFNAELCRSLYLTYEKDTDFEGIAGYKFSAPPSLLEDPRISQENRCFCANVDTDPESCLGQGALDLGPCQDGAPVAMSTAHFLDADPKYINAIQEGLTPDTRLHETFVEIEPVTGAVLRASKRIQLNLIMKQVSSISSMSKVKNDMLFPLIWADECAKLDSIYVDKLKTILFWIWLVTMLSKWGSLCIAIGLLIPIANSGKARGKNASRLKTIGRGSSSPTILPEILPLKPGMNLL